MGHATRPRTLCGHLIAVLSLSGRVGLRLLHRRHRPAAPLLRAVLHPHPHPPSLPRQHRYHPRWTAWTTQAARNLFIRHATQLTDSRALVRDRGSQGGFSWRSQHLDRGGVVGGVDEQAEGCACVSRPDPVAGATDGGLERGPGPVLGSDRPGRENRGRRDGGEGVIPCWVPMVPPLWRREPLSVSDGVGPLLSFAEREGIALYKARGLGVRSIARTVGRSPSTISRELRRNASSRVYPPEYRASVAQWHAERRARRPKTAKLVANERLRTYVQDRLAGVVRTDDGRQVGPAGPAWKGRNKPHRKDRRWTQGGSPEQIAQRLRVEFPDDESMRISHEAIYQALYVQSRGVLKRELVACLRTGRALRVPRSRARQQAWAHVTPDVR